MVGGRSAVPLGTRRCKLSLTGLHLVKLVAFTTLISCAYLTTAVSATNAAARSLLDVECDNAKHFAFVSVRVDDLSPNFKAIDAFRAFAASLAMQNFSTNCAQILNISACVPNTNGASALLAGSPSGAGCTFADKNCSPKQYYDWDIRLLSAVCSDNCIEQKGLGFVFCAGNVPIDVQTFNRAKAMFCSNACFKKQQYLEKCSETIEPQLNRCFDLKMKFAMTDGVTYPNLMVSVLGTVDRVKKEQSQSFNISLQGFKGGSSAPQRPFMMDLGRANSTSFWSTSFAKDTPYEYPSHFFQSDAPQLRISPWSKCPSTCGISWQTREPLCESQPGYLDRAVNCLDDRDSQLYTICTSTEDCDEFMWQVAPWMPCHKRCGGGFTTRSVRCIAVNGTIVQDKHCPRRKPATTTQCNAGACTLYTWLVGNWTQCSADCGGGFSIRPIVCVDHRNNTVEEKFCGARPKNFTMCGTNKCEKCENKDCTGNGACVNGVCKCIKDFKGYHCEVPKSCPTYIVDRELRCCESGVVDIRGICHNVPGRLDAHGVFCPEAKPLDACGTCGGPAKVVDSAGSCKAKAVDANGAACNNAAVDECGVCGGLGSSCALVLSLNVSTDPRSEAARGEELHRAIMPRMLALAGVAPTDSENSNILVANRGWTLHNVSTVSTVMDALIYPPFMHSTNNSVSVGSTQLRISQMLPWTFPHEGFRIQIVAPLLINRRGVCGNGICEIGERPIMGSNMTTFNVTNDTLASTEPFLPCPQDCHLPYRPCPTIYGRVCGGNGYCTGNGACMCFTGYHGPSCGGCSPGFQFNGRQCVYDVLAQSAMNKMLPKVVEQMKRTPPPPDFYSQLPHLPDSGVPTTHPGPHTLLDMLQHQRAEASSAITEPAAPQQPIPTLRRHSPSTIQQMMHFLKKHMVEIAVSVSVLLIGLMFLIMFLVRRRQLLKMMNGGDDKPVVPPQRPSLWKRMFGKKAAGGDDGENGESISDKLIGDALAKDNLVVVIDANKKIGPPTSIQKMEAALEKARLEEEIAREEADLSPQIMAVQRVAMEERGAQLEQLHVIEPARTFFAEVEQSGQSNVSTTSLTRVLSQTSSFIAKQWKTQTEFLSLVRNPDNVHDYEQAQRQASWDMGISNRLWDIVMPAEMMDWREQAEKEKQLLQDTPSLLNSREVRDSQKVDLDVNIKPSPVKEEHIALLPHEPVLSTAFMSAPVPDIAPPCSEITPADEPAPAAPPAAAAAAEAVKAISSKKPPTIRIEPSSLRSSRDESFTTKPCPALAVYKSPLDLSASDLGSRPSSVTAPSESTQLLDKESVAEAKVEEQNDTKQAKDQQTSSTAGRLCKTTQRLFGRFARSKKTAAANTADQSEQNLETVPICPKPQPQEESNQPSPEPPTTPIQTALSDRPESPLTDKSDTPSFQPSPPRTSPFQDSIALGRRIARQCSSNRSSASTSPFPSDPIHAPTCPSPESPTSRMLTSASRALAGQASPSLLVLKRSTDSLPGLVPSPEQQQLVRLYSDDVEHLRGIQHDWSEDGYDSPFKAKESIPREQPIGVMYTESTELGQLINEEITNTALRVSEDTNGSASTTGSQAWREEVWRSTEKKKTMSTVDLSVDIHSKFIAPTEDTPRLPSAPVTSMAAAAVPAPGTAVPAPVVAGGFRFGVTDPCQQEVDPEYWSKAACAAANGSLTGCVAVIAEASKEVRDDYCSACTPDSLAYTTQPDNRTARQDGNSQHALTSIIEEEDNGEGSPVGAEEGQVHRTAMQGSMDGSPVGGAQQAQQPKALPSTPTAFPKTPANSPAPSPEQLTPRSRADRDQVVSAAKELLARVGKPFKASFRKPPPSPSTSLEAPLPIVNAAEEAKKMQDAAPAMQEPASSASAGVFSPQASPPAQVQSPPETRYDPQVTGVMTSPAAVPAELTSYSSVAAAYAVDAIRSMMHSTSTVSTRTSNNSVSGVDAFARSAPSQHTVDNSLDEHQHNVMGWLDAAEHGHYEQSVAAAQARFIHRNQGGDELMCLADHDQLEAPPPSPADDYVPGSKSRTGQGDMDMVERTPSSQILEAARQLLASVPREDEAGVKPAEVVTGRRTWQAPAQVDVEQVAQHPPSPHHSTSPQLDIHNPLWRESLVSPTIPSESSTPQVGASLPEWVPHPNADSDDEVTSTSSAPRPTDKQTNVSLSGWTYGKGPKPTEVPASSLTSAPTGFVYDEAVVDDAVSKPYVYNKAVPHPRDLLAAARKAAADKQQTAVEQEQAQQVAQQTKDTDQAKNAPSVAATRPAPAPIVSAASSLSGSNCVGSHVAQEAHKLARTLAGEHGSPPIKHVRFESISALAADVLDGHDGTEATSKIGGDPLPADQAFNIVAAQLVTSLNSASIKELGQQRQQQELPPTDQAFNMAAQQLLTSQPAASPSLPDTPSTDLPTADSAAKPTSQAVTTKLPGRAEVSPSPSRATKIGPGPSRPSTPEKDNTSGRLSPLKAARAAVKGVMSSTTKKSSTVAVPEGTVGRTGSGSSLATGAKKLAASAAGALTKPASATKASPVKATYAFGSRVATGSSSKGAATASPDPAVGKLSAARLNPFLSPDTKLKTPDRAAIAPGVTAVPVTADKSPSDTSVMKSPRRLFGAAKAKK